MISAKCVVCLLINKHLVSALGTRRWAGLGRCRDQRDPAHPLSPRPVERAGSLTSQGHHGGKNLGGLMSAQERCQGLG